MVQVYSIKQGSCSSKHCPGGECKIIGARSHENSTIEYLTCNIIIDKYGVSLCTNNKFHMQLIKVHENECYLVLHLQ
jgi:hypothetical protein